MKKVFTDHLPRLNGYEGKRIDWKESVGYKVKFKYEEIEGEVEIVDYKDRDLYLKYLDKDIFRIYTSGFEKCSLGKLLNKCTIDYKIEIGQVLKDDKRDMIIINREYRERVRESGRIEMQKWYKYKCNKCGWEEGWIEEGNLLKRIGCGCCCTPTRAVVEGINDIPTTAPWMVKYFQGGYDEARLYSKSSNQKIYHICYDCGRVKTKAISINQLYYTHSIGCSCGDGISYPQKLMFKVLEQLEVKFETEYSPSWITPKKYDFYFEINNKKYIIEMDGGLGHGRKVHSKSKLTIKETLEIDKYKDKMAKEHSIKVIRINCKESDLSYIKNNILNSELSNLFDLNKIDWNKIEEFALINLVKVVCDHKKNSPDITTREIGKVMNLDRSTILIYLKKGNKLGWCNYSAKEESFKGSSKAGKMKGKQVEVFKDGKSLGIFESCSELERQSKELFGVKLLQSAISPTCNRKFKQYKGYTFRYIDE